MNHSIRCRRGDLPYVPAGMLGLLLVLTVSLLASGCLEPYPMGPSTVSGETAAPTQPLQTIPPTVSIQAEASTSGYIERSYGYVSYTTPPDNRLTYIDTSATKDANGMVTITGRIKNEGPGSLNYLHVTYTLFDSDGNVLDNTHASIEYLPQGKTWMFTTEPVKADNYQYFELARVLAQ
ncbi:MAG: FxLYD domain-containing protein [Methanoregulaceae archaeon]|nr:FxLYD domain-containing protein [Methanoregulaceae archaeon]